MTPAEQAGATALGWSDQNWNCLDGRAQYAFACSEDALVTFSFE